MWWTALDEQWRIQHGHRSEDFKPSKTCIAPCTGKGNVFYCLLI